MSMYGFSIRGFISSRRARSSDESEDSDSDESTHSRNAFSTGMREESWLTTQRPQSRKRPRTPIFSSTQSFLHNVSSLLLPLPDAKRQSSSASSLCSCEKHGSPRIAGRRRSSLCSLGSRDDGDDLSPQVSSATSAESDEALPLPKDKEARPVPSNTQSVLPRLESDSRGPLLLDPRDKGDTSRSDCVGSATSAHLSESVKSLIEEADKAFEIVGSTLRETDTACTSFNETPRLLPSNDITRPTRRASVGAKQKKKRRSRLAPTTLSPAGSVKEVKRKKSNRRRQMKAQRKSLGARNATRNNSKWTENVSDLLSGKLFHKIEADEMLTPAQIEAYKLRRLSRLQLEETAVNDPPLTLDTETVDTPVEPFHMDDLPSRIGSSGVKLTAGTPVDERPDPKLFEEALTIDFSVQRSNNDDELFLGETPGVVKDGASEIVKEESLAIDDPPLDQQIPMKSPSRYMFRKIPELPTISESNVHIDELFISQDLEKARNDQANAEYIFLPSTPYTMTAPLYRHGPIRIAKADVRPDPKLGADDGLDWTAFQMAILGGAGDYFNDGEHIIRRHEAEDIKTLCDWWDDWGFSGYGDLVTRDDQSPRTSASTVSGDKGASSKGHDVHTYHDIRRDNPYSARHRWKTLRRKAASEGRKLDLHLDRDDGGQDETLYGGGKVKKWSADEHASQLKARASMISMPQSPMLDLQAVTSDDGDVEYVPMGYNLSHDLGDFLTWETENVYSDTGLYDGGVI
ncbi:hypothetical protein SCUP234_10956 [Seiridium cupressi]